MSYEMKKIRGEDRLGVQTYTLRQHVRTWTWVRKELRVVFVGSDLHRHERVDVVGFLWRARRRFKRSRYRWFLEYHVEKRVHLLEGKRIMQSFERSDRAS